MSRILKVSQSDYRVKVQNGGTITLDTGVDQGTVFVTGDLIVQGNTTTINTANMTIEDNIIVLNKGEFGPGITEKISGIEIDRGLWPDPGPNAGEQFPRAQLLFNEDVMHYDPVISDNVSGTFVLRTDDTVLQGLQTNCITTDGLTDLVFDLHDGESVIRITNNDATAYSNRLLLDVFESPSHDNDIPNRLFVTTYVSAGLVTPGMADVDRIYKAVGGIEQTRVQAYNDSIKFFVSLTERARITVDGLKVDNVKIAGSTTTNTITTTSNDLIIDAITNNVNVDAFLNLTKQSTPPTTDGSGNLTKFYTNTTPILTPEPNYTPGQTGIYFTNTLNTDEVIAKNRALLFSMLF